MKKIIYYLVCTITILCATPPLTSETMNINSLREYLLSNDTPHLSGMGTYIRTVYKKAVNENDLLKGEEFKDDQHKQQYLRRIQMTTGIDISLKQDEMTHTLEILHFDQCKKRRDYTILSDAMVESISNDPSIIDTLPLKLYTFDGVKTICLANVRRPDGKGTISYADIKESKIYFPKFHQFGRNTSDNVQVLIDSIDSETSTINRYVIDGQVHIDLEMANGGIKLKWILAPDKGMSTCYTGLYLNNQLKRETVCQDYAQSSSGEWFPCRYTSNRYAHVKGEDVLISSEIFDAIPDTVNFNISIESSIFSPKLQEGTRVTDNRYSPPLEYTIESPDLEVFIEPLLKEETASHIPEKLAQNSNNANLNRSEVVSSIDKDQAYKVFIPEIDTAIKHHKPFIFDLSSGKLILIFVSKGAEAEKLHNSLMKLGKGDIAWDDSLVTVRNAKVLTISEESHRPLKCTLSEWSKSYSLPDKVDLPYSALIVTNEGVDYLMTIHEIEPDGIWITYKKLNADEVNHYRPKNK